VSDNADRLDSELVKAVLDGDAKCFRVLYERHYSLAVGLARSRLFEIHLAEDAAQEAFVIAFQTLHTLKDHSRFAQWFGTICRRIASRLERQRPHFEPLIDDVEEHRKDDRAYVNQRLHQSLQSLEALTREIVILHYFSELSYDQISSVVQLSPQAIHGRLQRARRTLRNALQSKESIE
jgi:RNA polymerase sigma-70 factor, ECF subfamily